MKKLAVKSPTIDWSDESKWFNMPKQRRSRATMLAILKAAIELFADRGYNATTPADIAMAAGVTTGSVYRRFPDKEAILYTVIEAYGKSRIREVTRLCDPDKWSDKTLKQILAFYVEMTLSAYQHNAGIIRIVERRRLVDPIASRALFDWREHIVSRFSLLLKKHSKLSLAEVRNQFRILHTILRGVLVHRILADPKVLNSEVKLRDSDLKAPFLAIALDQMKNL